MITRICAMCGRLYYWRENFVRRRLCRDCEDRTDCSHWIYDGCKDLALKKINTEMDFRPFNLKEIDISLKSNFKIGLSNFPIFVNDDIQVKKKIIKEYL